MRNKAGILAALLLLVPGAASNARQPADDRSDNMHLIGSVELPGATDVVVTPDGYAVVAVNGSDPNVAGLWTVDVRDPKNPKTVGHLPCAGSGYDIGLWRNIAVMSSDSAGGNSSTPAEGCNLGGTTGEEGIRLVDISDRRRPREVNFVVTPCGSHTNITFDHEGRGLVYVQSYPASTSGACPSLHSIISVVDITRPAKAKIVSQPSTSPAVGCHDGVVRDGLAYMACLTEGQIWDVSDPVNPVAISHLRDVPDAIWHSVALSNDSDTAVFGFESFGPGNASCNGIASGPGGALWFYDVSDPAQPRQLGHFSPPRFVEGLCTAHNFSVIPGADVVVTAWYAAGVMAVDFSDPAAPKEMAHYLPAGGTSTWDANWQRGYAFVGDGQRGLDIYAIDEYSPRR